MKALIILCCLPFLAASQKVKTAIDKLTGDTILYTNSYSLFSTGLNGIRFSLTKHKTDTLLEIQASITKFFPEVKESEEINFKLANGEIITLKSRTKFKGEPYGSNNQPIELRSFLLSPEYKLDAFSIEKLRQSPVVLIRFHYDDSFKDFEFRPEDTEILIKTLRLLFP